MTRSPARHPILLHGFTGSSASWGDRVVDGLAGAGLPPHLVDLPGHGRHAGHREPGACTLDGARDAIRAAIGSRADLVGYSMGGRLALHFAAAYPDRVDRLVLESASPGLETEAERAERRVADEALAARILDEGLERFVHHWEAQPIFASHAALDRDVRARQREIRMMNEPSSLAAALRGLGTGTLPSLWDRLPEIATPTLLVVGELDAKFVAIARDMAERMPRARLAVVPGAGHTVHLERPEAWVADVAGFLTRD